MPECRPRFGLPTCLGLPPFLWQNAGWTTARKQRNSVLHNHSLPGRKAFLETCKNEGVGLVAMKPFARGKLLQRNRTVNIAKYQSGGISIKKKIPRDITPIKCLSYTLSQTGVSTTIPGVKNVQELKENLTYLNASDEEKDFTSIMNEFSL